MSVKIDQALVSTFISSAFGLPIAHENAAYSPIAGTAYAELMVLQNDRTAFTLADSDETDGVFRVILRYPVLTGAITAKTKADAIFAVYKIGASLTYSGVQLTITSNQRQPGVAEDGWYKLVLSMAYRALILR